MRLISLEPAAKKLCLQHQDVFVPTTIGLEVLRQQLQLDQHSTVFIHPVKFYDLKLDLGNDLGELPVRVYFPQHLHPGEKVPTIFSFTVGSLLMAEFFHMIKWCARLFIGHMRL
ncbi:hypothetical protein [Liquorilactobacillus vini]|uniref:hypothetical protein n=1 Tax=Liquorilactobacillus vini TaxID=238015 RepID=UPI0002F267DC|nr:hypothetical protein [Liquorilactobacillus vini]